MKIKYIRSVPEKRHRMDYNCAGWSSIPDHVLNTPGKYLNKNSDTSEIDNEIIIQMIYNLYMSIDGNFLLSLKREFIKKDKIKIIEIAFSYDYNREYIIDVIHVSFEVNCDEDISKSKSTIFRKHCVLSYDIYNSHLRDNKLSGLGL